MIVVYEKPTCTTCRKLNKLLAERGIDYRRVNYFVDELSTVKLRELLRKANLSAFEVVRKNEPLYKELNARQITNENELIELIVANPSILQRPIIEVDDRAVLGRPIEKALDIIPS